MPRRVRSWVSLREAVEQGRGVERPFNCPEHDDRNASASVNVEKGVWYCYACNASGKTQDGKHDLSYIPMLSSDRPVPELPPLAIAYTNAYSGSSPYWAARYGDEVATRFRTGIDPVTGYPTVPIHDALGVVVHGFLLRRTDGSEGPKYVYPTGVPVSRLLFGHHLVPSSPQVLVLVEGASDVMALHRWPLPRGAAVAGVFGAGLHVPQAELVAAMNPNHVVVAMDADAPGLKASHRSQQRLQDLGVASVVYEWSRSGVNDPGDLEEDPWPVLMTL